MARRIDTGQGWGWGHSAGGQAGGVCGSSCRCVLLDAGEGRQGGQEGNAGGGVGRPESMTAAGSRDASCTYGLRHVALC